MTVIRVTFSNFNLVELFESPSELIINFLILSPLFWNQNELVSTILRAETNLDLMIEGY